MTNRSRSWLPAALALVLSAPHGVLADDPTAPAPAAAGGGSIVGQVWFDGAPPEAREIHADHDPTVCGADGKVADETALIASDGALANAVVVVQGISDPSPPATAGTAQLDQRGCAFVPHVQSVLAGTTLEIQSSDAVLHNVHAFLGDRTAFNLAIPVAGKVIQRRLDETGILKIRCDSGHSWMSAFIAVVPHRFHAVSAANGSFRIDGVPPGEYKLRAWHERFGAVEQKLTVTAGADATVSLTFKPVETDAEGHAGHDGTPAVADDQPLHDALAATRTELQQLDAERRADQRARLAKEGRPLFVKFCATCHGKRGTGHGPSARFTTTPPRDFTRGTYKFRMTPAGSPPTIGDLIRTISVGVRGTHMPAWKRRLSKDQIETLARYLTTLSDAFWSDAPPPTPIVIPAEPAYDAASVTRGQALYATMQCTACHGTGGAGDGPAAKALRDDWGKPIRPADFTRGVFKGGCCSAAIFRAVSTGLGGTPMPSFAGAMSEAERWDLAHYVLSLGRKRPTTDYLFRDPAGRTTPP